MHANEIQTVIGRSAYDSTGDKIDTVGHVYLDDETGQPEFASVNTGLFGMNESFVPLADANVHDDHVVVPYTKDQVKDAHHVDFDGGHLDQAEERRLYEHYGLTYGERASDSGLPTDRTTGTGGTGTAVGAAGHDTSGPDTDSAMTRSEERLDVGTTSQEAGRVRLRKYVTTEQETVTVPVRKERAVLETEPITDANRDEALAGPDISEEEHEVVLEEERPVVGRTAEPVERVRLGKETVTDEETVTEEVRKEHIDADGHLDDRRGSL
jgi:uncharacterized protein (TIGR02271 family)